MIPEVYSKKRPPTFLSATRPSSERRAAHAARSALREGRSPRAESREPCPDHEHGDRVPRPGARARARWPNPPGPGAGRAGPRKIPPRRSCWGISPAPRPVRGRRPPESGASPGYRLIGPGAQRLPLCAPRAARMAPAGPPLTPYRIRCMLPGYILVARRREETMTRTRACLPACLPEFCRGAHRR
jgi:hypothetical protein